MLDITVKPHRASLKANAAEAQKVFLMLKMIPNAEVAQARPPVAIALVIDTSGSMMEFANQQLACQEISTRGIQGQQVSSRDGTHNAVNLTLPTKLDQAIEAAHYLVDDSRFAPEDQLTIVHFDDNAAVLLPLTPLSNKQAAHQAVESLRNHSGGTQMSKGMEIARQQLSGIPAQTAKRVFLLTDGRTTDEAACLPIAGQFAETNTPVVTIGIGEEYNENLMRDLADISQGRPYHLQTMDALREILDVEIGSSTREVITDLQATVSAVKGVVLDKVVRVYPSLSDVSVSTQPYKLGNVAAEDYTVFVFEFTISGISRPPSRARIMQVGLAGYAPALRRRDEFPPQDIFVAFSLDAAAIAAVDPEVLGYVQQMNVDRLMQEAARYATVDAGRARQTLQVAMGMTRSVGNSAMTRMLRDAEEELNQTGTISAGTRKTIALGGRTKTVKTGSSEAGQAPSEDEIRRLTGA